MYKDRWAAAVGELFTCSREPTNESVRYAVAVIKEGTTIGHLPRKIFKVCSVFLRSDGVISCKVTGLRRFSDDLCVLFEPLCSQMHVGTIVIMYS